MILVIKIGWFNNIWMILSIYIIIYTYCWIIQLWFLKKASGLLVIKPMACWTASLQSEMICPNFFQLHLLGDLPLPWWWLNKYSINIPRIIHKTRLFHYITITDWCFGTWIYDFPYIGNNNLSSNWRTHMFQRGRYTTNQVYTIKSPLYPLGLWWLRYSHRIFP